MRKVLIALLGALVLQLGLVRTAVADPTTTTAPTTTAAPTTTVGPTTTTPAPQTGVFDRRPSSGPVGTVIAVKSITPCVPPEGASSPEVDVVLFNGRGNGIAVKTFPIGADGTWSGNLTVPANTAAGAYTLGSFCFASISEQNPFFVYEAQEFTVTTAAVSKPAVPVTKAPTFTG